MSIVRRMDHFTIVTDQPDKTKQFYIVAERRGVGG